MRYLLVTLSIFCALFISVSSSFAKTQYTTPNNFLAKGTPTFIIGTLGDNEMDELIEREARFIRNTFYPKAKIVKDTSIDLVAGKSAWPPNPVLLGGAHVNAVTNVLAYDLPFSFSKGQIIFGKSKVIGDDLGFIAVLPSQKAKAGSYGYPEFLLYAGSGALSLVGMHSVEYGSDPLLIVDTFGRRLSLSWKRGRDNRLEAFIPYQRPNRVGWRRVPKKVKASNDIDLNVNFHFIARQKPKRNEEKVMAAVLDGLALTVQKLMLEKVKPINVYIYDSPNIKKILTGRSDEGHVSLIGNALHLIATDEYKSGELELLAKHKGAYLLAYKNWGAPGSAFMIEGIAVWASGSYNGVGLKHYSHSISQRIPKVSSLLGVKFKRIPKDSALPLAGLVVGAMIEVVGITKFVYNLYTASEEVWEEAAKRAGTDSHALQKALALYMER